MTELHNVPFPTVNGQSELLDIYMPTSPATAGGRPVIVAIHGGGWRRFNKAGYGSRVADAFVQNGYVVVAPDYVLSEPGSPTWPENLEDVQAACAGCALTPTHWGSTPTKSSPWASRQVPISPLCSGPIRLR